MANNELQRLVAEYRAEREKAGDDPVARNTARYIYGVHAEQAEYEDRKALYEIDWNSFDPSGRAPRQSAPDPYDELPRDPSATADMLWEEFGSVYKGTATEQEIEAAASQVVSEHGSNWARSRLSSAGGRAEFYKAVTERLGDYAPAEETLPAEVFGAAPTQKAPAQVPGKPLTREEANQEWLQEFNQVRTR